MAERSSSNVDNQAHSTCDNSSDTKDEENRKDKETKTDTILDCPVCLQTCSYPVKLACGHIFCFLCIKGVVFRSKRCALCRQDVDLAYFKNPVIVKSGSTISQEEVERDSQETSEQYQWYYEGRNGWWQYDDASSAELEKAHKDSKRSCELLIAGFLYFIDFDNMVQFRKTEPGRRRRIKRDVVDAEKKGVAGLRIDSRSRSSHEVTSSAQDDARNCEATSSRTDSQSDPSLSLERLVIGSSTDESPPPSNTKKSS